MTAYELPAADAPASEWGALAAQIPGAPAAWHRTEEFVIVTGDGQHIAPDGTWWRPVACDAGLLSLDVDHPATAGCLLEMLGDTSVLAGGAGYVVSIIVDGDILGGTGPTIGRAAIAAAAALGRWPGGGA